MENYKGKSLIADPVHGYISFTVKNHIDEVCEQDIIDTPWVQRLRYIYQLQSARWVFPSAEHSRFQHSLGTMHVAGKFGVHLYDSLKRFFPDIPSCNYIEELLRLSGLLHDIGHGPFGHFFDDNYLDEFGLTHESVGALIITDKLGEKIKGVKRSVTGPFEKDEILHPEFISYIINKHPVKNAKPIETMEMPGWLEFLKPIFGGIYTADNLDYVLRDAYMCGVAIGPIDLERLIYYSCFTEEGLTIHKSGLPALTMFLSARLYLYSNVYYHRTTRAIDMHLKDIFRETIKGICAVDPLKNLDEYLMLTDWLVIESVKNWKRARMASPKLKELAKEWELMIDRQVKWKMAFSCILSHHSDMKGLSFITDKVLKEKIISELPDDLKDLDFRVDMASQDPRPLNLLNMGGKQIYVLNPQTERVSAEELKELFDFVPAKVVLCRIYSLNHDADSILTSLAERILDISAGDSCRTNL